MRAGELAGCRQQLEEFAGEVFAPLGRRDQRAKGGLYLRGLLLDGRRKSMQPMAERLGIDHQQLQQFMTSSTWPVKDVRARLAWRAVRVVRPQVWVVDDTGFPMDGTASPGVARQPNRISPPTAEWVPGRCRATRPISLREHVLAAGRHQGRTVFWRKGSKAAMSSHFVLVRVRLARRRPKPAADGTIPLAWLIAQWPEGADEPVKYWISNLPADLPVKDLVRLAKSRWRIEHDYREMKTAPGLDHFEGRSFAGWHRHVTLVTAAHLFLTEQRRSPKASARA
ncbi:transposase [Streptomyces sp. NPDC048611]|uniref:transposase n=1 Tax=Streptomyces sp. NPDC048611 TaxID=3155635 RepID=UPI003434A272